MTVRPYRRPESYAERRARYQRAEQRPASLLLGLVLLCCGALFLALVIIGATLPPTFADPNEAQGYAYNLTVAGIIAFAAFATAGGCLWNARP